MAAASLWAKLLDTSAAILASVVSLAGMDTVRRPQCAAANEKCSFDDQVPARTLACPIRSTFQQLVTSDTEGQVLRCQSAAGHQGEEEV